jgi:hypothetical protein
VKQTFYDDQTPVWLMEKNRVLFPWKVSFSSILFSEEPFITHFIKIEGYIDGYGMGELSESDLRRILEKVKEKFNVELNIL